MEESEHFKTNYSIKYHTHISQGILVGLLNGELTSTLAIAKTTIIYPESLAKIFKKFFNDTTPITITNIIHINGTGKILVKSPAFVYEEALSGVKVSWDGLNLYSKYNESFSTFNNKLSIPKFYFNAPNYGSILIKNIYYQSTNNVSTNQIKVGTTNLTLNQIEVKFSNLNTHKFMLGDLLQSLTGLSITKFINELDVIDPTNFTLNNLSYNSNSDDTNNYFNASAKIFLGSMLTESKIYGPLKLETSLKHILSQPFSKMIDDLTALSVNSNLSNNIDREKFLQKCEYWNNVLTNLIKNMLKYYYEKNVVKT
jgi:uncharacterized protein YdgA (DUF945 family)